MRERQDSQEDCIGQGPHSDDAVGGATDILFRAMMQPGVAFLFEWINNHQVFKSHPLYCSQMQAFHNTASSGHNLHSDLARSAHEFLCRNGNSSVDSRILLSQLGAALAHLKPVDPTFKWSHVFAAHPHLFQMLDLHVPGKATIYAVASLASQHQRPPLQRHHHRWQWSTQPQRGTALWCLDGPPTLQPISRLLF